ncbi:replication protein [Acinetobacter pittii]|uniref:replication protein n=1 Tax=Acinetobacter pittii TaxID=48296 RepID=UPI001C24B6AF|nr:replication protein [Acinetobacter pittii]QXA07952.1 replication protein [Acinetobacter pittii]
MNLAYKHDSPQGEVIEFPKHERQVMSKKEEGYTRLPNSLIDDQIMAQLNDKAFKCLMYIVRQTVGYDRLSHAISITQFQKFCGIKKRDTVMAAIKELEKSQVINVERKNGQLSEYTLTTDQYREMGPVTSNGTSTINGDGTRTVKGDGTSPTKQDWTSPVQRDPNKENIKENPTENFKENLCEENSVDSVLKLWVPKLEILNAWLQRAGITKMTQVEAETWLLEINGYYSSKIEAGLLNDTQMYTNFVKWIKRSYSTRKPAPQQMDSRNVNDAWKNNPVQYGKTLEEVEIPEDWI